MCDTGIFHCVWMAVWSAAADQTANVAQIQKFLLMMGTFCPKHVEKLK